VTGLASSAILRPAPSRREEAMLLVDRIDPPLSEPFPPVLGNSWLTVCLPWSLATSFATSLMTALGLMNLVAILASPKMPRLAPFPSDLSL
jgi:hypothetical protein